MKRREKHKVNMKQAGATQQVDMVEFQNLLVSVKAIMENNEALVFENQELRFNLQLAELANGRNFEHSFN